MKTLLMTLALAGSFAVSMPVQAATLPYGVTGNSYTDGWPKWIGRLEAIAYFRNEERPQLRPEYLPLALIRTGAFDELVKHVKSTPNMDMSRWPEWIDEVEY